MTAAIRFDNVRNEMIASATLAGMAVTQNCPIDTIAILQCCVTANGQQDGTHIMLGIT